VHVAAVRDAAALQQLAVAREHDAAWSSAMRSISASW
jgi:hypothetical protein